MLQACSLPSIPAQWRPTCSLVPSHQRIICRGPHTSSNVRHRFISLQSSNPPTPPSKHAQLACQGFGRVIYLKRLDWRKGKGRENNHNTVAIIMRATNASECLPCARCHFNSFMTVNVTNLPNNSRQSMLLSPH